MKVLHVITSIDPASGGPTRSVKGLCRSLSNAGIDTTLLVVCGHHLFENACGVHVLYKTAPSIEDFDIVHLHGLWQWGVHKVAKECQHKNVKYVISPRGMLDPWALSVKKWKKFVAMFLYQRRDLEMSRAFHATAEAESEHIRACGLQQPIMVAPNGVDLPTVMPERMPIDDFKGKTAIFLSRLHPGKGLLTLADAWAQSRPQGWRMLVIGPDSYGHKKEVFERLLANGISDQWRFVDAVNDIDKWRYYRSADLLVHPSVSENFGITIAEGLVAGLPVIATKGTPWGELESRGCGWWVDVGVEPLVEALTKAVLLSDAARRAMGERGRKLVEEKYTWEAVVRKMVKGYEEVLHGQA